MPVRKLETRDPDLAHEWLSQVAAEHKVEFERSKDDFRLVSTVGSMGETQVQHLTYEFKSHLTVPSYGRYRVVDVVRGNYSISVEHDSASASAGQSLVIPSEGELIGDPDEMEVFTASIPQDVVHSVASEYTNFPVNELRFHTLLCPGYAARHRWTTVSYMARHLIAGPPINAPLFEASITHMLAMTMLDTYPNSVTTDIEVQRAGFVESSVVRRAKEFIDDNAHRPITVPEIAAAADVGARGLQAAFRRHLDTTPQLYLRRVRLERAHRDLQASDQSHGDSVRDIATRWGFVNAAHFSTTYRNTYGVSPSTTLRS